LGNRELHPNDFRQLFTPRQAYALHVFAHEIGSLHSEIHSAAIRAGLADDQASLEAGGSGARAYADAVSAVLALSLGKMAQSNCILVRWFIDPRNGSGKATPAFDRHAVPMVWDFVETNPFGGSVGDWTGPVVETALRAIDLCVPDGIPAVIRQGDARSAHTGLTGATLIATDPPYYANIGYADLSDFFYLWIRDAIRSSFPVTLSTLATPKTSELIASPFRHASVVDANAYFRSGFSQVFGALAERADPRLPILIVYAIKQSEEADGAATGWEVFLGGLIDAGLSIVATWPVRTTTNTRMIGLGNNALASAVFVIGRPRPSDAPFTSKRDLIAALQTELPSALARLQKANIAPVDLAQAAIGPGMSVFTRYSRVIDSDGAPVTVRDALALINRALDEALAHQESDFDADTRWALTWFDQFAFADGEFGTAETLSRAKNTSIEGMVEAGILASRAGKVRLLAPDELPAGWDPEEDRRIDVWEMLHHLIRVFELAGESAAATLLGKYGARADVVRELAYRLYAACERKKRAKEASSYNALVQSWPEILRLAQERQATPLEQPALFEQE
jgi:putative DNA methylase